MFRKTDGDLPKVYRAILLSSEFAHRNNFRAKFKSPFEFVVSAIRATEAEIEDLGEVQYLLGRMGQSIYRCEDPTGYFDQTEAWLDPGVLVHRWDFALRLGKGKLEGVRIPDPFFQELNDLAPPQRKERILELLATGALNENTDKVLSRTTYSRRLLGLALGSPVFQQQ